MGAAPRRSPPEALAASLRRSIATWDDLSESARIDALFAPLSASPDDLDALRPLLAAAAARARSDRGEWVRAAASLVGGVAEEESDAGEEGRARGAAASASSGARGLSAAAAWAGLDAATRRPLLEALALAQETLLVCEDVMPPDADSLEPEAWEALYGAGSTAGADEPGGPAHGLFRVRPKPTPTWERLWGGANEGGGRGERDRDGNENEDAEGSRCAESQVAAAEVRVLGAKGHEKEEEEEEEEEKGHRAGGAGEVRGQGTGAEATPSVTSPPLSAPSSSIPVVDASTRVADVARRSPPADSETPAASLPGTLGASGRVAPSIPLAPAAASTPASPRVQRPAFSPLGGLFPSPAPVTSRGALRDPPLLATPVRDAHAASASVASQTPLPQGLFVTPPPRRPAAPKRAVPAPGSAGLFLSEPAPGGASPVPPPLRAELVSSVSPAPSSLRAAPLSASSPAPPSSLRPLRAAPRGSLASPGLPPATSPRSLGFFDLSKRPRRTAAVLDVAEVVRLNAGSSQSRQREAEAEAEQRRKEREKEREMEREERERERERDRKEKEKEKERERKEKERERKEKERERERERKEKERERERLRQVREREKEASKLEKEQKRELAKLERERKRTLRKEQLKLEKDRERDRQKKGRGGEEARGGAETLPAPEAGERDGGEEGFSPVSKKRRTERGERGAKEEKGPAGGASLPGLGAAQAPGEAHGGEEAGQGNLDRPQGGNDAEEEGDGWEDGMEA